MQDRLDAVQWQVAPVEEIPVSAVACLRGFRPRWPTLAVTGDDGSIDPAVQNLLLAARAAGLGAALTTLPLWSPWQVRRALHLPYRPPPAPSCPWGGR